MIFDKINKILQKDKLLHFFVGSLIFSFSMALFDLITASLITVVIAVAKEVYDVKKNNKEEYLDIVFTILPILLYLLSTL